MEIHDWILLLVSLVGALVAGGLGLNYAAFRKAGSEAGKTEAEAWALLVSNLSERVNSQGARIMALEAGSAAKEVRINELEDELEELREWIIKQGLTPPPRRRTRERKILSDDERGALEKVTKP